MILKTKGTGSERSKPIILGELTLGEARLYQDLIEQGVLPDFEIGGFFDVSFNGAEAIKHPQDKREWEKRGRELLWEYKVGKDLERGGVQVPKFRGVYVGEGMPLLLMETIGDLTRIDDLRGKVRREAGRQYEEQTVLIHALGYKPGDTDKEFNCGFHRTRGPKGTLFFFDFIEYRRESK